MTLHYEQCTAFSQESERAEILTIVYLSGRQHLQISFSLKLSGTLWCPGTQSGEAEEESQNQGTLANLFLLSPTRGKTWALGPRFGLQEGRGQQGQESVQKGVPRNWCPTSAVVSHSCPKYTVLFCVWAGFRRLQSLARVPCLCPQREHCVTDKALKMFIIRGPRFGCCLFATRIPPN